MLFKDLALGKMILISFCGVCFHVLWLGFFSRVECFINMQEASRLILGLRAAGWNEKDINDFILYIETGDEKYKPQLIKEKE